MDSYLGEESIEEKPIGEESIEEKPIGEESIEKELIGEESIEKELIGEESIEKELIGEESIEKELIGEESIEEKAIGEESIEKEPIEEKPIFEDQIDVTRMPYRTELRRPDLKGTFRCSLCNKIFCHSSSLSRHRMQAHFKSYTCTLCNKEITSNETLRAHMYKKHQISRMFMCRCCNWAFPDKTSLHIHMQAMATGNPGNVSIIAKSSTSPPAGASAAAAAALNGMANSSSSRPGSPGMVNGGMLSSTSPLSMTPPGLASGIFPTMPSREDLITRIRERAIFGGIGAPGGLSPASMPGASNGGSGGFDLASLFPNIAAAAKLTGMNPAALASLLPSGLFGNPNAPSASGSPSLGHRDGRRRSDGVKLPTRHSGSPQHEGEESIMNDGDDYSNAMVIDEDGEEINCEMADDDEEMNAANGSADGYEAADEATGNSEIIDGRHEDEEPYMSIDSVPKREMNSPSISANGSRRSSLNARKLSNDLPGSSVTVNVNHSESPLASLQQQFQQQSSQDLPVLRSAISASPLNSLLYQKKLNNALRNKNTDPSLMANFFYPSPLQQLQQVQMQLAAAAVQHQQQQQQQPPRRDQFNQRRKSSSAASTSSLINNSSLMTNGYLRNNNDVQVKREHLTPSPLTTTSVEHQQNVSTTSTNNANPPSDAGASGGSHISPTESSVGSSSSSTASSAGQTSPTSILDTTTSVAGGSAGLPGRCGSESCSQCTVLKGRLALTENRCRFLESKTTSQESKISRLESRIGTLESNGRRYENEAHMLRDHCEQLEKKVLDCQERVLRYLQGQQYDQDTTKQMLYDILETCRVYKPA